MDSTSTIKLHTGNAMPVIGLGTWKLDDDTSDVIAQAIDMGYRMIDTSSDYGTQPGVGKAIDKTSVDRDQLFIVTKVEETDDAYAATKQYVSEMGLEYADLMLIHRPPQGSAGQELWEGLIRAKEEGFTRDIGVSNYSIPRIKDLMDSSDEVPVVNQIEWTPFGYSDKMYDFCDDHDIVIQAYSPLTRGNNLDNLQLNSIAARYDKTPAQVMIRWCIQQEVVPLPKANQIEHVKEDLAVFDFEISEGDMDALDNLNAHYSALGSSLIYIE